MKTMKGWGVAAVVLAVAWHAGAAAQSQFIGDLEEFTGVNVGEAVDAISGEFGEVGKVASWGVRTVRSSEELAEAYEGLGADDGRYDPLGLDSDGFQAPSACAEDVDCQECYENAMERIDFNRYYLHRAWSITTQYSKFAEGAMAFGDSASGIHGVTGLSWQLQGRPPIKQSLEKLHKTYRAKYADYIDGLERSMTKLGQCEARYAGGDRWFGRYAAVYVDMIKTKYRIED
ncbi:MAG TPA: hypothetical protein VFF91_07465 [Pseudoxanthomonas sp.]|nr:hypothetical protein [Pseudoxanthomonas sp.]